MADALRAPQESPGSEVSADDEAFYGYMEGLRHELEQNWNGGYAQMPNEIRADRSLSHKAKEVYEQLLSYMWFKSDRCWPSQETIAEATGYSRRSVIRALNELYERGFLEKWRRGLGLTNYYFINPLSFVRSFRPLPGPRTATSLPHTNILFVDAPELRLDLSKATPRPVEPRYPEVPICHNESANVAQPEMSNWHTKQTQTNPDPVESQHGYTRSGGAAGLGTKGDVGPVTIRNEYTKGTNEDQQRHQSKSNTTATSQETGGAARAEEVKEVKKSRRKKHAPGEIPPPLPEYLASVFLAPISLHFCDQSRESSKTSFAWMYADVHQRGLDEYSEQFHNLVNEARDETKVRASRGEIRGRNRDGAIAMMPYFLSTLETNVDAWCKAFDKAVAQQPKESANESASSEGKGQQLPATPSVEEDPHQQDVPALASIETCEADQQEEMLDTDVPNAGWSYTNAFHYADRLQDLLRKEFYSSRVVRIRGSSHYGFVLSERRKGGAEEVFVTAEAMKACSKRRALTMKRAQE